MFAESAFPNINAEQSQEEKTRVIMNYLYMLLEQLRYSFRNIGQENFNPQEFQTITEVIQEPIVIQITQVGERVDTAEENATQAIQTANGLATRVTSAEGDISTLQQTATSLSSRVTTAEGNASQAIQTANSFSTRITTAEGNASEALQTANSFSTRITNAEGVASAAQQTANSFSTRITTAEGNASQAIQTANGFSTRITTAEGNISTLQQTATGLRTDVNNAAGAASTAQQTAESITLTVTGNSAGTSSTIKLMRGQTQVTSQTISFSGLVKFTDLSTSGNTTIVGDNITSGTIKGVTLESVNNAKEYVRVANGMIDFGHIQGNTYESACHIKSDYSVERMQVSAGWWLDLWSDLRLSMRVPDGGQIEIMPDFAAGGSGVTRIIIGRVSSQQWGNTMVSISGENIYLDGNVYVNGNLIS